MCDPLSSGLIHHLSTTQDMRLIMKEIIPKTNADEYCQKLQPKEKPYLELQKMIQVLLTLLHGGHHEREKSWEE